MIDVESATLLNEFCLLLLVHVIPAIEDVALASLHKLLADLILALVTPVEVEFGAGCALTATCVSHLVIVCY